MSALKREHALLEALREARAFIAANATSERPQANAYAVLAKCEEALAMVEEAKR